MPAFNSTLQIHPLLLSSDVLSHQETVAAVDQTPSEIPIGTPISLLFINAALVFLPTVVFHASPSLFNLGVGNLGGSSNQTILGTIEHDFQHLVTHPQGTAF
jgi:hypothetical protein